ncbi:SdrD B-like domain-containing protein [Amycolatopsis magusensis]|uniref:SdrD B-like domain-containing protein n=1 Tax=Amycolatopsis magusensis TaxID=882444 RepID=UPI003C2C4F25
MNGRRWRRWVVFAVLAAVACLLTACTGVAHAEAKAVGGYVWFDTDRNGLQDQGEPPAEGVRATLVGEAGVAVGTTLTGEDGRYLFGDLPDGGNQVCFDVIEDYELTRANAGNDALDSDADPETGCTPTGSAGLDLDAGLMAPGNELGDYVWLDQDANGLQNGAEPAVEGVEVGLHEGDGSPIGLAVTTGPDGRYTFGNLPDGPYLVCFGLTGREATEPGAGDDESDSDADPATGCTEPVTVGPGNRRDFTLDLGLLEPSGTPPVSP